MRSEWAEDPSVRTWREAIVNRHDRQAGTPVRLEGPLGQELMHIKTMILKRHAKYGPGNIAEFGTFGVLVRMADKFARLKAGEQNFDDETVNNTLDDIIGYALIWKLWNSGQWPGSAE